MKLLCKIFGHKLYFDCANAAGSSTCKRCGHKEPAIVWPRAPVPTQREAQKPVPDSD